MATVKIGKNSVSSDKRPASLIAQEKLLELFKKGAFKGGDPLRETVLSVQFGVTRPAMREALHQAVGWGIVEYLPYRGYQLRKFTIYDLLESYEIREAIVPVAAWRLAQACPPKVMRYLEDVVKKLETALLEQKKEQTVYYCSQFHIGVIENCGNKSFARFQNICSIAMSFYSFSAFEQYHNLLRSNAKMDNIDLDDERFVMERAKMVIDAHWKLLDSIKSGDPDLAERCFKQHSHKLAQDLRDTIMYRGGL